MFEPSSADAGDGPVLAGSNQAPGAELAGVLAGVDVQALGGDALTEVIAGCERLIPGRRPGSWPRSPCCRPGWAPW